VSGPVGETKGERTRRRLLELAVRRFADEGYRATSVSAIAREAGVTQAAVYAYFANKEALFEAAVDLDAAELIAGARAELDEDLPLVELIPGLLLHLRVGVEQHRLARRVLAGQEPEVIHRLADLPALQDITRELAGLLAEAQARAEVPDGLDVDVLAIGVETVVLSLLMSSVQVPVEADTRVPGIVAVFQALFRPPPGQSPPKG
jgi:AcrR family transcriptional regulator